MSTIFSTDNTAIYDYLVEKNCHDGSIKIKVVNFMDTINGSLCRR